MVKRKNDNFNIVAEMDQFAAVLADFSTVLYAYYDALKKQGFSDEQAMLLVLSVQNKYIGNNNV